MKLLDKAREWFGLSGVDAPHGHSHDGHSHDDHGHTHGVMDATIASTERGITAIKWSFVIMAAVGIVEFLVVSISGSVALLADMIHNFADATTAIPLWVAFQLVRRKPTLTFNYGLGRVEDLAGLLIVMIIMFSTVVAGSEAIDRFIHPQALSHIGLIALMGIISYAGNEAVAMLRIRIGREINSAALIADGYHARIDALTALAVVAGAFFVWLGFPLADPIVGLVITFSLIGIVWQSSRTVLVRMLDGVDPGMSKQVRDTAAHVQGIRSIDDVKARWIGHKLHIDACISVDENAPLAAAKMISDAFRAELFAHIPALAVAHVRFCVDDEPPAAVTGDHHDHGSHSHDDDHHHAPQPFSFDCALAQGSLSIIDTPEGERFALTIARHAEGLTARVAILRPQGVIENHALVGDHHRLLSTQAPAEPHEFDAQLHLSANGKSLVLPFAMQEPDGHHH